MTHADDSCRLMINLKNLNEDMPYIHSRMETFQSVLSLIISGCYLAPLELKHACYSLPIRPDHTKILKLILKNQLYKFLVLSNGLLVTQENLQN